MTLREAVGTELRLLREGIGATQRRIGAFLSVDQSVVARREVGKLAMTLEEFADHCDVFRAEASIVLKKAELRKKRSEP